MSLANHITFPPMKLAMVTLAVCVSSFIAVWFGLGGSSHHSKPVSLAAVPPISMDAPLPFGQRTTLAHASSLLGTNIALPNTPEIAASTIGSVWTQQLPGEQDTAVGLTFPGVGLIIQYQRPAPYPSSQAPLLYQAMASEEPSSISVTSLAGVPALAIKQNSDSTGANFGSIEFVTGDTRIVVIGHYSEAALEAFAGPVLSAATG